MDIQLKRLRESYNIFQEAEKQPYHIFVDMDGVIADFDAAFQKATEGRTDIPPAGNLGPSEYEDAHGKDAFWNAVEGDGEEFWSEMPWTSDGQQLWSYVEQFDPTILSAPSRDKTCVTGKVKWLKQNVNLPNYNLLMSSKNGWNGEKIILFKNKYEFVTSPNDILIDDTPKKIKAWDAAGGTGILHTSTADTIQKLQAIMGQ